MKDSEGDVLAHVTFLDASLFPLSEDEVKATASTRTETAKTALSAFFQ